MKALFEQVGVSGVVDIVFVALLIYGILVWLRRTRRAAFVLVGILIVAAVYLLAQQFGLSLMVAVLQGFFAVFLIALVVIFQEELRSLFERVAAWSLGKSLPTRRKSSLQAEQAEMLARTLGDLSRDRIGALIVLRGRDPLARHLSGGEELDGLPSEAILKSLFDPHSLGHDGAVVFAGDRIRSFGAHLPLSSDRAQLARLGTRHAAALGLAERTDAMCLVVSEERGTISVAHRGRLETVEGPRQLQEAAESFLGAAASGEESTGWRELLTSNLREKVVALGLASALWFVLVHESTTVYRSFRVPVKLAQVPAGLTVLGVEPAEIEITVSAPRKSFYLLKPERFRLAVRTWELAGGRNRIPVTPSDISFPDYLSLENIKPREVLVEVAAEAREPAP